MDQFNALPFPQKVLVLVIAMVLVAGLFYYSMIIPIEERQQNNLQQRTQIENDLNLLKAEMAKNTKDAETIKAETEKLKKEEVHFQKMLPRAQELEPFITSLSDTARNAGLKLTRFTKNPPQEQDYYLEIPIHMRVEGTYRSLVGFMRAISNSDEDRRVVNIRDFSIERRELDTQKFVQQYEEERRNEAPEGHNIAVLSPTQRLAQLVKANEEAIREGVILEADFTAVVFTYTGKPASAKGMREIEDKKKAREERRKKRLMVM